jgi:hypothetical protein
MVMGHEHAGPSEHEQATPAPAGDPSLVGSWQRARTAFEHLPIHTALLRTGQVLGFGGSCNNELRAQATKCTELFDPATQAVQCIAQELESDLFCCGTSILPDGRVLAAGGTARYDGVLLRGRRLGPLALPDLPPFLGLDEAYVFDPESPGWTRIEDMAGGRWYPTLVTLGDGRVLAVAGLMGRFPWFFRRRVEVYTPGSGWSKVKGASRWMPMYPHLHLLPDGDVFFDGCYNTHYLRMYRILGFPAGRLQVPTGTWKNDPGGHDARREEGSSVLLPLRPPDYRAQLLLIGGALVGEDNPHAECRVVDLSRSPASWETVAPLGRARYYSYSTLLPDGTVFTLGGARGSTSHHADAVAMPGMAGGPARAQDATDTLAILETELFDPASRTWKEMAPMALGRNYHSGALLLPDGRVIALGGNRNRRRRDEQLGIEIFSPPYLHQAPRPTIAHAPFEIEVGREFEVQVPDAEHVDEVVLIRPGSTTHCVNTDQRFVEAAIHFTTTGALTALIPRVEGKPYVAPPGYYMLFVLREGVPSAARFVRVTG